MITHKYRIERDVFGFLVVLDIFISPKKISKWLISK